jgi:FHA domain
LLDIVLLVLKIAILVLLFLFIYLVVRRTAGDVLQVGRPAEAPDVALPEAPNEPVPVATPAERRVRRQRRHVERTMPGESLDLMAHIEPRLVVVDSPVVDVGTVVRLEGGVMIGRSPTSDVVLDDPFVSQTHARVVLRGQLHYVEDLGSTNGTYVNGHEVVEAQLLIDSELRIGETVFRYEE